LTMMAREVIFHWVVAGRMDKGWPWAWRRFTSGTRLSP
jgi:hypothetical protein